MRSVFHVCPPAHTVDEPIDSFGLTNGRHVPESPRWNRALMLRPPMHRMDEPTDRLGSTNGHHLLESSPEVNVRAGTVAR